ncbi:MAG: cytochrome c family protein [Candidatus Firestonebacteria bacterium]|nr:cytochrome c family protein [Candidatus Firestonebacteria bacterium]
MRKRSFILVSALILIFIYFNILNAEENDSSLIKNIQDTSRIKPNNQLIVNKNQKAKYVGARECGVCHTGKKMKNIFEIWQMQGHARAFERLKGSDQENPKCLKCHTTGFGEEKLYEEVNLLGVQCEACHGPGSLYRPMDIMEDLKRSNELGLIYPIDPMKVCRKCHLHRQDRATPLCPGRD